MNTAVPEEIRESGLVYTTDSMAGIYRKGKPGRFYFEDAKGNRISDGELLKRIQALVIPPAWQQVWIAPHPRAYLQVTGIDAAGRKQYKYHPEWTSRRSEQKYYRLLDFGKALPKARKALARDLRRRQFDERKVLAICVSLLEKTLIRIGNRAYAQRYGSYGLSTLRNRHAAIRGNTLKLAFTGKKGVKQELECTDARLARLVRKCKEIPGQELFQYYTRQAEPVRIDSGKINDYIREITAADFTAKDFRTWGATLEALRQLAASPESSSMTGRHRLVVQVLDKVADKLGNTRAVCKSAYVFPALLEAFEQQSLQHYLAQVDPERQESGPGLQHDEAVLLRFLKASAGPAKGQKKNKKIPVAQ